MTSKLWRRILGGRGGRPPHHLAERIIGGGHQRLIASFRSDDLKVEVISPHQLREKPPVKDLGFGKHFTDHMLRIKWSESKGWESPVICQMQNFQMHPAAKVLHYAQELFEGMKAYRGIDNEIRMFRPMHNMTRMLVSARRSCLPEFDPHELVHCIRRLIQIDQEWVPHSVSSSLYIRPTMIGIEPTLGVAPATEAELFVILSPVGPYFSSGVKPVNLLADPNFVRAWPGGSGYSKMGSNYAPTLYIGHIAAQHNCHQALWLYGPDEEITEVGAMNIFALFQHENGKKELVTPPLDSGLILPGVTRRSVLEMARETTDFDVNERKLTIKELLNGAQDGSLVEMFGTGTAAIVSPVGNIFYDGVMKPLPVPEADESFAQRVMSALSDIYYGKVKHPWGVPIEDWSIAKEEEQRIEEYKKSLEARLM